MKKIILSLTALLVLGCITPALAHHHPRYYGYYSTSCPVYLINQDFYEEEIPFHGCERHSLLAQTTTNYYSNGTRRIFTTYNILNANDELIAGNYSEVKHAIHNNKHYFIVKQKKTYKILDENGFELSKRNYKIMFEVAPNKLVVKSDKKYGIINLQDDIIVPIKYQKFERIGENIFLTKLNGYWGITDLYNNTLIKNDCEKITQLYDTLLIKRYNKYGLVNLKGEIVLAPDCDKIKKLGEHILVKRNGKYGLYSADGNKITDIKYKKIRLERNNPEGQINKLREIISVNEKI